MHNKTVARLMRIIGYVLKVRGLILSSAQIEDIVTELRFGNELTQLMSDIELYTYINRLIDDLNIDCRHMTDQLDWCANQVPAIYNLTRR